MAARLRTSPLHRPSGFSLIELVIAVAIIGFLAAVAYPTYQEYVIKSYRGKAQACMAEYAQFMERYYTTNMTYVDAAPTLPCRTDDRLNERYTMSVNNVTQGAYVVNATPIGGQAAGDPKCGTMSLNEEGTRSVSGDAAVAACW